jgi:SH3-like domain-containing protein
MKPQGTVTANAWSIVGVAFIALLIAGMLAAVLANRHAATAGGAPAVAAAPAASPGVVAAVAAHPLATGASGLPVPRFVSLKTDRVNVRRGPSNEHQVVWVYARKGLPVEIIAESELWRRVRDSEGEEGWVYHSLLAGRRTALIAPWRKTAQVPMLAAPGAGAQVALLEAGVIGEVQSCSGQWCRLLVDGYEGWIAQNMLWGVYPGERIE